MAIRFFDMFAGIGGFRSGLEAVGGYECIGHCEIDRYVNQAYKKNGGKGSGMRPVAPNNRTSPIPKQGVKPNEPT